MSQSDFPSVRELLELLVRAPGPPGQEGAVRDVLIPLLEQFQLTHQTDAKGNLLVGFMDQLPDRPEIVVTAHLDEIALMVTGIEMDGGLSVTALGGAHPWKWGEGPVEILARETLPGVLSFGSIHTTSPISAAQQTREGHPLTWNAARILTGLSARKLTEAGVRPGTRAVIARSRRTIVDLAEGWIASYFLDDRADLVSWILALVRLSQSPESRSRFASVLFAATASEEVGGEGAMYLLHERRPSICIALEIGPSTPDAPFPVDANPTVWVTDSFATSSPADLDMLADIGASLGFDLRFHAVTRGGSDASCAASRGLCARPITLAFAAENSHGFEIMHQDAPENLASLLAATLYRLTG